MRPRVFPAEDTRKDVCNRRSHPCFNEAAGIPRGRRCRDARVSDGDRASMRPRVFPAEDAASRAYPMARPAASMRPRVFPAEDAIREPPQRPPQTASMRPRVFPAEDVGRPGRVERGRHPASMRPRVFPAEDAVATSSRHADAPGFNEAAGIPRGRLGPRLIGCTGTPSFNEAAGIPRGRRTKYPPTTRS